MVLRRTCTRFISTVISSFLNSFVFFLSFFFFLLDHPHKLLFILTPVFMTHTEITCQCCNMVCVFTFYITPNVLIIWCFHSGVFFLSWLCSYNSNPQLKRSEDDSFCSLRKTLKLQPSHTPPLCLLHPLLLSLQPTPGTSISSPRD